MESLPVEIIDEIIFRLFCDNPRDVYQLRCVSKLLKENVDRCIARFFTIWRKKCLDEIPEICLDDMVQTRFPQFASWQEYCLNELPMPHIAREIYKFRNNFPYLVGNFHLTEYCPMPETGDSHIVAHAVDDKYLAISIVTVLSGENKSTVRVYSIDDLNNCIREYSVSCRRMDLYTTDNNQVFLVMEIGKGRYPHYKKKRFCHLAEFLVNDRLIQSNLPADEPMNTMGYVITKNQCFTFNQDSWFIMHRYLSSYCFEKSSIIPVWCSINYSKFTKIIKIQICASKLFVSVLLFDGSLELILAIYQYQITQQRNGNLLFCGPEIYQYNAIVTRIYDDEKSAISDSLKMNFVTENIRLQNGCNLYPEKLDRWAFHYFRELFVTSLTIHAHHVLILCLVKLVIFRGNLQQLMNHVVNNADPSSRCTVIDLESNRMQFPSSINEWIHVIHIRSKPKFIVFSDRKVVTIDHIP